MRIMLCPAVTVVDDEHILTRETFGACTQCYVKRVRPLCVGIVAIGKIASVQDDCLEIDVRTACGDVDESDRHEVHGGPSVGMVTLLLGYHVSSAAFIPQLRLQHLDWLVAVQSMSDLHARVA
jgi:hypothetical protein